MEKLPSLLIHSRHSDELRIRLVSMVHSLWCFDSSTPHEEEIRENAIVEESYCNAEENNKEIS